MGHSSRTVDTYYTSLGDDHRHVEAYQAVETLRKRQLNDSDPEEEPDPVTVPRRKRTSFTGGKKSPDEVF